MKKSRVGDHTTRIELTTDVHLNQTEHFQMFRCPVELLQNGWHRFEGSSEFFFLSCQRSVVAAAAVAVVNRKYFATQRRGGRHGIR